MAVLLKATCNHRLAGSGLCCGVLGVGPLAVAEALARGTHLTTLSATLEQERAEALLGDVGEEPWTEECFMQ